MPSFTYRIDFRHASLQSQSGLDDFCRDDPVRSLIGQIGTGMGVESSTAGPAADTPCSSPTQPPSRRSRVIANIGDQTACIARVNGLCLLYRSLPSVPTREACDDDHESPPFEHSHPRRDSCPDTIDDVRPHACPPSANSPELIATRGNLTQPIRMPRDAEPPVPPVQRSES